MKRLQIITQPTSLDSLSELDADGLTNTWQLKAERLQARRMRRFKHSLA